MALGEGRKTSSEVSDIIPDRSGRTKGYVVVFGPTANFVGIFVGTASKNGKDNHFLSIYYKFLSNPSLEPVQSRA